MTHKEHFMKNIMLATPVMLSQLGHIMVGVVDSIMVGQLGKTPLAGVSLANSIFAVPLVLGIGLSYGITPLVASAHANQKTSKILNVLKHGFVINIIAGVLLFILLVAFTPWINLMNQPEKVVIAAKPYLLVIASSIIPFMVFQTYRQFLEGISSTTQIMIVSIGSNLINIGLNYLLIFGKFGFPKLGLVGAGWATLIARLIMGTWIAYYAHRKKEVSINFKNYNKDIFKNILKIGLPSGLQLVLEIMTFSMAAIMMGWISDAALAAHQIAISLAALSYMMASGISAAATVRVGNQWGKKDFQTMREAGYTNFIIGGIFMSVFAIIFIMGRNFWPTLYIDQSEVIQIASSLLVIASFFQISDGIQVVGLGALRGMGDVKIPTLITLIAYWVIGLPMAYFLSFILGLGAKGVWYGLLTALSIAAILLSTRFFYISRRKIKSHYIRESKKHTL